MRPARWAGDGFGTWIARDRTDGSLVGRAGFTRFDLHGEAVVELGWAVRYGPLTPAVAFTEVHNHASRAVMRRLGLGPAGEIRRPGLVEGATAVQPDARFALYRR